MDNDIFNDITEGLNEFISHKKSGTLIEKETIEVAVPDVKEIRRGLKMTQTIFSNTFGFDINTVKAWEQKKRTPHKTARHLLLLISANPDFVINTIHKPA